MEPQHISKNLIPLTETDSKELRKIESTPQKTGDEKLFVNSLKTPQVIQRPIEDLKEVLRLVMVKLGIRAHNWPAEQEKDLLIKHIVDNFGGHTHEEIKLAFDLAMAGKLNPPDDPKFAECFENFSCAYFSKIMSAYRVWAAKTYKAVVKEKVPEGVKEDLNDQTMQEMWNLNKTRLFIDKMSVAFIYPSLYEWRDKRGEIKTSGLKKSEYMAKAVEWIIEDLKEKHKTDKSNEMKTIIEDFNRMKSFSIVEAHYTGMVTLMAKRLMIHEMMKNENDQSDSN